MDCSFAILCKGLPPHGLCLEQADFKLSLHVLIFICCRYITRSMISDWDEISNTIENLN